jgi:Tol biopolymer transport system component
MKTVRHHKQGRRTKESLRAGLWVALLLMGIWPLTALAQPACGITQITDGNTFGALIHRNNASINADGTRLAFHLDADLTGSNADGNFEIFLFDRNTNTFTQITHTTSGAAPTNFAPSINADGTRIAFESNANPTGENPNANFEIYLIDTTDSTITQATHSPDRSGTFNASINAAGTHVAFESDENLTGGNPDFNREIFLFNTASNTTTQLTNSTGSGDNVGNFAPSINADGTRIAFHSNRDLTGGNADGNAEIFLFDTTTGTLTQITHSTEGGLLLENRFASLNADGTRIAFESGRNLSGNNPDRSLEIFSFNTSTSAFTQVTDVTAGDSASPSINADGTRIAFVSRADLTGGNDDGYDEIFLASCEEPAQQ